MQRKFVKNLMLVLTLVVLCMAVGMSVSALEPTGQCGDNVYWTFDETTGELVISGEGAMWDDSIFSFTPIKKVVVEKNITSIGSGAFYACHFLEELIFEDCSLQINGGAFTECFAIEKIDFGEGEIIIGEGAFGAAVMNEELYLPSNIKEMGIGAFYTYPVIERVYVEGLDTIIDEWALCATDAVITGMTPLEYVEKFKTYISMTDRDAADLLWAELENAVYFENDIYFYGTIYAHTGSTAEAYATTNEINFVATHFFEGEWTYDYDNMIRYRKCIHCDELETEPLETTESGDVEIIEPTNPDTDFTVDVVEDYVVIEETISNNITTDFEIVKAFDINLKNKDGVHVQPDGTVKVKLPLDWSKDGVYKVYRVNDDGTLTDMNAYREGSHMVFDTDHFSIYVIVDESEKTDAPTTPDEPKEETKDNFFSKLIDFIKAFFDLIASLFKR